MTKATIPIASVPRGAPPQTIRTKAPTHPSQAEPKGQPKTKEQPSRSFDEVLAGTRDQPADSAQLPEQPAAQPKPDRAEDAPSEPKTDIDADPVKDAESQATPQEIAPDHTMTELSAAERRQPVAPGVSPGTSDGTTPEPHSGDRIAPPTILQTELAAHSDSTRPPAVQPPPALQNQTAPKQPITTPATPTATEPNATPPAAQPPAPIETAESQAALASVQLQPRRQSTSETAPPRPLTKTQSSADPVATQATADEGDPSDQPRAAPEPLSPSSPVQSQSQPHAAPAPTRNSDPIFQLESAPRTPDTTAAVDPNARQSSAPAPTNSKPALPAAPPQDTPPAPQLVARGLTAALAQRGGVVHVRLVPVSLGEVRIQMTLDAGTVSVKIDAATPAAQNLLNEHLGMLRASLESRGLQVDRLAVNLAPAPAAPAAPSTPSNHNHSNSDLNQSPSHNNQQDAAGSQSRGRSDDPNNPNNRNFPEDEPDESLASNQPNKTFNSRLRMRLSTFA